MEQLEFLSQRERDVGDGRGVGRIAEKPKTHPYNPRVGHPPYNFDLRSVRSLDAGSIALESATESGPPARCLLVLALLDLNPQA